MLLKLTSILAHLQHRKHCLRDGESVSPVVVRDIAVVLAYTEKPPAHILQRGEDNNKHVRNLAGWRGNN